jgi:hypothetical protein
MSNNPGAVGAPCAAHAQCGTEACHRGLGGEERNLAVGMPLPSTNCGCCWVLPGVMECVLKPWLSSSCCCPIQGANGKVKPIPEDEQFAGQVPAPARPNCLPGADAPAEDVVLAIRLQEEELLRHSRPRQRAGHLPDNGRSALLLWELSPGGTPHSHPPKETLADSVSSPAVLCILLGTLEGLATHPI